MLPGEPTTVARFAPAERTSTPEAQSAMRVVAYDTADARLARWGVGLERWSGDGYRGWVLDLPAGDLREEVRLPGRPARGEAKRGEAPAGVARLVALITEGIALRPVVRLHGERAVHRLATGGRLHEDTWTWESGENTRQIKVMQAEPSDLFEPDARYAQPRAVLALGPPAAFRPVVPPPRALDQTMPAGDVVRAHLAEQVRALVLQDMRLRCDLPDAVHQVRVAARRLRSGLLAFRDLVDRGWAQNLRGELSWLADEVGRYRDTEVLLEHLMGRSKRLPAPHATHARAAISRPLRTALAEARDGALTTLDTERYRLLITRLIDSSNNPPFTPLAEQPAGDVLPALARRAWQRLKILVKALDQRSPIEAWHQVRIRAKQARYAAEALVPVYGRAAREHARALAAITGLLGEQHDSHVAAEFITELAADPAAFALGLLAGHELAHADQLKGRFEQIWTTTRATRRAHPLK